MLFHHAKQEISHDSLPWVSTVPRVLQVHTESVLSCLLSMPPSLSFISVNAVTIYPVTQAQNSLNLRFCEKETIGTYCHGL